MANDTQLSQAQGTGVRALQSAMSIRERMAQRSARQRAHGEVRKTPVTDELVRSPERFSQRVSATSTLIEENGRKKGLNGHSGIARFHHLHRHGTVTATLQAVSLIPVCRCILDWLG